MLHKFPCSRLATSFFPISYRSQPSPVRQSSFLFFTTFPTLFKSKENPHKDQNFTISYLVTSCGLFPEAAERVSQNLNLKTPDKPNAVLNLLKNYGFSEAHIAKCVQYHPRVLLSNPEKTLLPKLKFLHSIGVPIPEFPLIIAHNHTLLGRSLDKCFIPRYNVLKSVLRNDVEVFKVLKRGALSFLYVHGDVMDNLIPNVSALRDFGVPQASISYLVMYYPGSALIKHSQFVEVVKLAKEMGLDPLKTSFVSAIHVLINVGRAKWESRLEAYMKWGWSQEIALSVFRKSPTLMSFGEERITKSMNFLVKDMGWASEDIARYPQVLTYSLEKRIIPRCSVIKILKSKGLVKNRLSLGSFLYLTEEVFLKRFVTKFLENLPLLLDVYQVQNTLKGECLCYVGNGKLEEHLICYMLDTACRGDQ